MLVITVSIDDIARKTLVYGVSDHGVMSPRCTVTRSVQPAGRTMSGAWILSRTSWPMVEEFEH